MAFRPLRNPRFQRARLAVAELAALSEANRLAAAGQPQQAAPLFAQVAQALAAAGHPRRAATVHTRAAHAYADGGNETAALAQSRTALSLFSQQAMEQRLQQFYTNIIQKLRARGMAPAAETLQREFAARVGNLSPVKEASDSGQRGRLPSECPKCAAPVRSDEVGWIDSHSAECPYCGAVLQTPP